MEIINENGQSKVYSWSTGSVPIKVSQNLDEEARRNPTAVFNRLCREGKWDEAEKVLDNYVH